MHAFEDYDRKYSTSSNAGKETLMIVTNGRQSSRRPPVLVIGSELCLMFDLPPRDVRVDNDHIGAALMLEERGMFVPYGR